MKHFESFETRYADLPFLSGSLVRSLHQALCIQPGMSA